MVLESLFNPFSVKKRPWQMFVAGFLYSIIGLFISYLVFRESAGLLTVFLISISGLPLIYTAIKNEEELDLKHDKEWKLLKEHTKVLMFFMFLFFGILTALVLVYVLLPQPMVESIFNLQHNAIANVNQNIHGITGNSMEITVFANIFTNNIKVLFFCILFSFLFGTGALFILTWNASVVAVATGKLIKFELAKGASLVGLPAISNYFNIASFSLLRYMTHGIVEMAAYMVAGLAGGIISIAMIKHNLKENKILIDSLDLILISIGLIFFAAIVEVYITPLII